tara:strand:- start:909 stop:1103 length:195 start_codon:yes stop_codon:yes gene_type:complete
MKEEKRKNVEIINDIINILNQSKDEDSIDDFLHIDNLREEIDQQPDIFRYTLTEFDNVINKIFK